MRSLHDRIIEISKKHGLTHLGSCLTAVDIIDQLYAVRKKDEPFVLSCGHAALALYVVLEKYLGLDAEKLCLKHGTHPTRNLADGIYCSTGSLGWGLTIALGMAMADRSKNVYCLISDGESFEGTIWETANVMHRYNIKNLHIHLNWNGWAAYHETDELFIERLQAIFPWNSYLNEKPTLTVHKTSVEDYGLKGQSAHYVKI